MLIYGEGRVKEYIVTIEYNPMVRFYASGLYVATDACSLGRRQVATHE